MTKINNYLNYKWKIVYTHNKISNTKSEPKRKRKGSKRKKIRSISQ